MLLELSREDAQLLSLHLSRRIDELDQELVRTDVAKLQHALARDIERLRLVLDKLQGMQAPAAS